MKTSVLITSYKRPELLMHGLYSLTRYADSYNDINFYILDDNNEDDGTEVVVDDFKTDLNVHYIRTGKNKKGWRTPAFAFNIGLRLAFGSDFVFLSCAEMYHMQDNLTTMLQALADNPKRLTICEAKDDDGSFLDLLNRGEVPNINAYNALPPLVNVHLPFFMGMNYTDIYSINGYDEDMIGCGYDDDDIVSRLRMIGNEYCFVDGKVIHLYHDRIKLDDNLDKFEFNKALFLARINDPVRNKHGYWGEL